jgi:hypothetical protein
MAFWLVELATWTKELATSAALLQWVLSTHLVSLDQLPCFHVASEWT